MNFAFIENALTAIHAFGAKGWWQSLVVILAVSAVSGVSDHFLGVGNAVTKEVHELSAPVSPTIVISPTTVQ